MYSTRGTKPHRSLGICSTLLKKHTSEENTCQLLTGVFTLLCNNPFFADTPQSSLNNSNSGIIALLDAVMVQKQSLPALQDLLFLLWIKIGHHDLIAVKAAKRELLYKLSFFFGIIGQKAKLQNFIPVIQVKIYCLLNRYT